MRLVVEPGLGILELFIQLFAGAVELLRAVVSVNLEHVLALLKSLEGRIDLRPVPGAVFLLEGRARPWAVRAILGFALGTALGVGLDRVPLLLESVEV